MDDSQIKRLLSKEARKYKAEESLYAFLQQAWHVIHPDRAFVPGRHIEAICEHLEAVSRGEIRRLLICVPPRSSKSTCCAVMWPAWIWARRPEFQWLCLSHKQSLATRDTRLMRVLVQSKWYQERWPMTFASDQNQKTRFENDAKGIRVAGSLIGVQGEDSDTIVVDDPHDRNEAWSEIQRQSAIDAYREGVSTRLNDPDRSAIIVVGQRLHQGDLIGYLSELGGWERLTIPMRYEPAHPLPTTTEWRDWREVEGETICEQRFPESYLVEEAVALGAVAVAGQWQQRPSPAKGSMFEAKHFRYFQHQTVEGAFRFEDDGRERVVPADECVWFQSVDTALKVTDDAAYTVCVTVAATPPPVRMLLVDVFREKLTVPEQYPALRAQTGRWPMVRFQAVEEAASGTGIIQRAVLDAHPMLPMKPYGSKETRASTIAMLYGQGSVYHLAGAPFLVELEGELLSFPTGTFKDQVDAMAWAGIVLQSSQVRGLLGGRDLVAWPAKADPDETDEDRERRAGLVRELTGRSAPRHIREDDDSFGARW